MKDPAPPSATALRESRQFAAELKFLIAPDLAEKVHAWAAARLVPDPHSATDLGDAYCISSLYFDTPSFDVFHRRASYARSKYRVRRYGPWGVVFLERKLKTRGLVSKRRTPVPLDQLARLEDAIPNRVWNACWYHQRLLLRRLGPVCEICYRRCARIAMTQYGPARLTLDAALRAQPTARIEFNGVAHGTPLLADQVVLELKYRVAPPAIFKHLIEEFALIPEAVSKYRLAITALGLASPQPAASPLPNTSESVLCQTS